MIYSPDYNLTYIESTIQRLSIRAMWISPADVLDGLGKLDAAGIKGSDGETSLYTLLECLTPYATGEGAFEMGRVEFPGWTKVAEELAGLKIDEMSKRFGTNAVRAALVIAHTHKTEARVG